MSFGIVPAGYSVLLWGPLVMLLGALALWLLGLILSQPASRRLVSPGGRRPLAQWVNGWRQELAPGLALAAFVMGFVALVGY